MKHGTNSAYAQGCRCYECTNAHRKYQTEYMLKCAEKINSGEEPGEHGTRKTYDKGCRCDACRAARAEYVAERKRINETNIRDKHDSFDHGKIKTYNLGCRCDACKDAHNSHKRKMYAKRKLAKPSERVHGTNTSYNSGCRCDACVNARRAYNAKRKSGNNRIVYSESHEERKRSNDAWRQRLMTEWGLA